MLQRFHRIITRFIRAQAGLAYLEFAISLPFLLSLFMGTVEITRYIVIVQKVEKASTTLSDLVAQSQTITTAQLNQLILAAGQIIQPYAFGSNSYAIITSVTKTGTNAPVVNWQYAGGGTWTHSSVLGTPGAAAILPPNFTMADRDNVIFAEVFYSFTPLLNGIINTQMIYKVSTYKPRLGNLSVLGFIPNTERSVV